MKLVATTSIFLSTKVEETPIKLVEVIRASYSVQHKKQLNLESDEYRIFREKVLQMERIMLQTLGFDLKIEHPYKHLLQFIKKINGEKKLAQTAWNFVNDSLRTTLCLQYPPDNIAAAAIYLASKYLETPLPSQPEPWQKLLNTDQQSTDDISTQILDLYEGSEHSAKIKVGGDQQQLAASQSSSNNKQ